MAVDFDGTTGFLYRLNDSTNPNPPIFVSLWFYPDSAHDAHLYTRQRATFTLSNYQFLTVRITASSQVEVGCTWTDGASLSASYAASSNTYSTSAWNHVLAYYDPNDFPAYAVWLNGTKTTRNNWVSVSMNRTCLGALITGTVGPAALAFFDGRLADVAEWDNDDGSGLPFWVVADMDKLVTGLYNARMSPDNFLPHRLRRCWPLFSSEYRPEGTMGQAALNASGTVAPASHAPVNRRQRGFGPSSTGRIVTLGTNYKRQSRIVLP